MHYTTKLDNNVKEIALHCPPVIIKVNEFTEASADEVATLVARAQNTGQDVLPVVIDSYGGQVYSLLSMIASLRTSKIPVATIVTGKAMSCGAILFSCGAEGMRFMDPDATVMIHDVSSGMYGKVEELSADVDEAKRLNKKIYKILAQNCGKKESYFQKIMDKKNHVDWFLEADECVKHNLANHVRVPEFRVNVKVEMEFDYDEECDE